MENEQIKVFRITLKEVLKRLSNVDKCKVEDLKDLVVKQFDDYNYEGEEELQGLNNWCDISKNGKYELTVGIDHEDAYEFTLYINVQSGIVSMENVL